jgi:serine protease Do
MTRIAKLFFSGLTLTFLLAIGGLGFGVYEYQQNKAADAQVLALQGEIQNVRTRLEQQAASSSAARQQPSAPARPTVAASSQGNSLTAAIAKVAPQVVSVVISEDVPQLEVTYVNPFGNDPSFREFGIMVPKYTRTGSTTREQVGAGTGFIIRSDGYILTNRHVVTSANAYYTVLLSTGVQKQAQVAYRDPNYDLAVLKISGTGYPTASFGDSSNLQLGQTVAAIGNALGQYNNSVSVGVISGLNRTIEAIDENGHIEQLKGVIQTDAAINPGNSGGPLLDLSGNIIGVNVATAQGANNVSFALPINEALGAIRNALP